jgi:hypothetical protein
MHALLLAAAMGLSPFIVPPPGLSGGTLTGGLTLSCTSCGITLNTDGFLKWSTRSIVTSPADGVVLLTNAAGTSFTRLDLGGTSSSSPAIAPSSTTITCRLGDNSAGCPWQGTYFATASNGHFFDSAGAEFSSTGQNTWSSGGSGGVSVDTGLARGAAGLVKVTNGSSGDGRLAAPGEVMDVGTTCTKGEIMIDTGGATVEICVCQATDTIRCVATTTTNPTN